MLMLMKELTAARTDIPVSFRARTQRRSAALCAWGSLTGSCTRDTSRGGEL